MSKRHLVNLSMKIISGIVVDTLVGTRKHSAAQRRKIILTEFGLLNF